MAHARAIHFPSRAMDYAVAVVAAAMLVASVALLWGGLWP